MEGSKGSLKRSKKFPSSDAFTPPASCRASPAERFAAMFQKGLAEADSCQVLESPSLH